MPPAREHAKKAATKPVWRMRILNLVAVLVVASVRGDPTQQWAVDRHRTQHSQEDSDRANGLERTRGEQAVEADCDPKARCGVHGRQDDEIDPRESPPPEAVDGHEQSDEGRYNSNESSMP
jgi:hypothetical protein